MNIFKKIFSLMAAVILFGKCSVTFNAGAEEAPHDIKLTCETKYIDIDEIPEDRMVKLAVSIDNNPGFQALCVLINIDSRLRYNSAIECEIPPNRDDIGCINYALPDNCTGEIEFDIFSGAYVDALTLNAELMYLKIMLPDNVNVGDFFNVDILKESDLHSTYICLNLEGEAYDANSFSELNCGGIHIVGDEPVQQQEPISQNQDNHADDNINKEQKPVEQPNVQAINNTVSNQVTTVTSTVTTPITSLIQTNVTTSKTISSVTTYFSKTTDASTSVITENDADIDLISEDKKSNNIVRAPIAAVLIIIIGGGIIILIKKSKKDK